MDENIAEFRFYEELNDFLPLEKRKTTFQYAFYGTPSLKDAIEALGVPHTEVDLILVNGTAKKFSSKLNPADRVAVYPVSHLRKQPLRKPKFILDVHLGKLARYLRLLGFDVLYQNNYEDTQIVKLAQQKRRIILTRDIGLLKNKKVLRGYWLRSTQPKQQLQEIVLRFDLANKIKPFIRCLECNGKIITVGKKLVDKRLAAATRKYYEKFYRCHHCKRIYWQGSHYQKLKKIVDEFRSLD